MIEFKTHTMETEFNSSNLDTRVRNILLFTAGWAWYVLDSSIEITSVYRTDSEQMRLYGGKMPSFGNVHGAWRAIDFVIKDGNKRLLEAEKCERIETLINKYIQHDIKGKYPTCVFHNVGHGWHFHIQVSYKNQTKLRRD